jgi:hypothetical protein
MKGKIIDFSNVNVNGNGNFFSTGTGKHEFTLIEHKITGTMTKRKYNRAYWMGEASPAAAAPATESPDTQVLSMQRQSQHPDFAISDIAKSGGAVQN